MSVIHRTSLSIMAMVLLIIGLISYYYTQYTEKNIKRLSVEQLASIGHITEDRIDQYLRHIEETVYLFNSRLLLGKELARYAALPVQEHTDIIKTIDDILVRSYTQDDTIKDIIILDTKAQVIASKLGVARSDEDSITKMCEHASERVHLKLDLVGDAKTPILSIGAPIFREKVFVGMSIFRIGLDYLNEILKQRKALGQSGEVLVGKFDEKHDVVLFTPLRFASFPLVIPESKKKTAVPMRYALQNREHKIIEDELDYRDVPVISSVHYCKALDIGIVVKKDIQELMEPVKALKEYLLMITLISVIIAIALSMIITHHMGVMLAHVVKSDKALDALTERLKVQTEDLKKAQRIAKIGSWRYVIDADELSWSDETYEIFQIDPASHPIRKLSDFVENVESEYMKVVIEHYERHLKEGVPYSMTHELRLKDGTSRWIKERCETIVDDSGRPLVSNGILQDITESKRAEKQIEEHLRLIDRHIILSSTDLHGKITQASEAFSEISGYSKEELIGKNHRILRHPDMDRQVYIEMWERLVAGKVWRGELKNRKKSGECYWIDNTISPIYDDEHNKIGYTSIRHDITDKKKIERLSITDELTGIFNRRYFNEMFSKTIKTSKRNNERICFLMFDIDHFKQYNDTYGHQKGDQVLKVIANTIYDALERVDDYLFRLGGEEFGIIYKANSSENAYQFADRLRVIIEDLKIPHDGHSSEQFVTVSMGLVCKKALEIEDEERLYEEADVLLYRAKESGRNRVIANDS